MYYISDTDLLLHLPWNAVTVEGETAELGWGLLIVVIIDGAETDIVGVTWLIVDPVAWRPFNAWTCWIAYKKIWIKSNEFWFTNFVYK